MKRAAAILILVSMAGCNLAPRYNTPEMTLPETWRINGDETSTAANMNWWEAWGDPMLNDLIKQALDQNKDLQTAIWRVKEYYARYEIVRSAFFPQINLEGTAKRERFPSEASFLPIRFRPVNSVFSFDFNLNYELDFWGKVRNASKAAYQTYLAQVEDRKIVVQTLVSAVAQTYALMRQLDLQLQIAKNTLKTRGESLKIATYRFEGGLTSEIEVTQAISAYEETEAKVKELERDIPLAENLLSVLIGEFPHTVPRGVAIDKLCLPLEVPNGLPSELLLRRPDIAKAEHELIAANAVIGVARAAFFPQLSLTGLWGAASLHLRDLFKSASRAWMIGGDLMQAIFQGFKLKGRLDEAKAVKQETLFQYEQTVLNAFKEVNDSLVKHQKAKELYQVYEADVDALKEYLNLAWLRYYEGQTDYLTVLDAERQLFDAQLEQVRFQGSQFITLVDVYKSLGGGWIIDADKEAVEEKKE